MKQNIKKFISLFLTASILMTTFFIFPFNSYAYDLYDGKPYELSDGVNKAVVDTDNGEYWVVSENKWHKCIYNDDCELSVLVNNLQNAMYKRESDYSEYFIIKNEYLGRYYNATADGDDKYIGCIFDYICEAVYSDKLLPYGGDYLEMLTNTVSLNNKSCKLTISTEEYSFFRIELKFDYVTELWQEKIVADFLDQWNETYILDNDKIMQASGERRKYYIVKTIFNFLAKNTVYDNEVFADKEHIQYPVDSDRYKVSHSAYGALVGNLQGSFNEGFSLDSYNFSFSTDSQKMRRVYYMNQGRSVCDGYSLVFYYLCKLNGIDCRIITGDYVSGHPKAPDAHAWNEVYLKDDLDTDYEWYSVDATFGSQCTQRISDEFTYVDYEFFLRGTENINFSFDNHQQPYTIYDRTSVSPNDYRFTIDSVDVETASAIVTRRRLEDIHEKYVTDGIYNLENYALIEYEAGELKLSKIMKFKIVDGEKELVDENEPEIPGVEYEFMRVNADDSFVYNSGNDGYWYEYEICDYARGVEYLCSDRKLKESGDYYFDVVDPVSSEVTARRELTISRLDMSDWKSYDEDLTKYSNEAIYSGNEYEIFVEIVDAYHTKLSEGVDYSFYVYSNDDASKTPINPKEPGKYTVRIDYKGNYDGFIEFLFEIKKIELSYFDDTVINFQYGIDIEKEVNLSIKDKDDNRIVFEKNKDYSISVDGGRNYLDEGTIKITGLEGSNYIQEGSVKIWKYVISKRLDLSSVFAKNNVIRNEKHTYTGSPIKPDNFLITYTKSDGKEIELKKDVDYKIVGYGENIDAGKGTVNIEFIGNYEGSAELYFLIEKPEKFNVTVSDLTYNGKTQNAKVKVTYNGITLKEGVDYTVSGSGKAPGFYNVNVQGINNFSRITGKYTFIIKPSALTSLKKADASVNRIKLSWTAQGGMTAYQIYAYDTAKKKWYLVAQTTTNSVTISAVYLNGKKVALKDATKYSFRVRAMLTAELDGKPFTSYGAFASLDAYTLPKTTAIKNVKKGKNYLTCSWTRNANVTGYQIFIANNSAFTSGKKYATIKSNKTVSYTFKNLKKGKTYYVRIRTYKTIGGKNYYSAYSKTVKIKL